MTDIAPVKLCGHVYRPESDTHAPFFWPLARAWAASGGHASLSSGINFHHGQVEEVVQNALTWHSPEGSQSSLLRRHVSRQRAYSALAGIYQGHCKRCRKELAAAFLKLFDAEAQFDVLRTDTPHGAGLLATDHQYVGILFAEFNRR